jgi:hypothetical protein
MAPILSKVIKARTASRRRLIIQLGPIPDSLGEAGIVPLG